jgi:aspartate 4-decarboxylase
MSTGADAATTDPAPPEVSSSTLTRADERELSELSPFECKARLQRTAVASARARGTRVLDAGRGNPNWVATTPRAAFFLLGQFALGESRRVWEEPDLGGMPAAPGIAARLDAFLADHHDADGAALLAGTVSYGVSRGFEADAFVHELTDGIIGDRYPGPDRIAAHAEQILREYLADELLEGTPPPGDWDLFAVEGGTAAICYVFDSLAANLILQPGDRVALMVPAFTPYLEIPRLERYDLDVVELHASSRDDSGEPTWQFPDSEIDKLADPSVKALFVVNPSNPPSVMLAPETLSRVGGIVATSNPGLIIVTDDVYGTFVPGFRSLMDVLPANTIAIYSFSKYFGATGWRLGVVALYRDNVVDRAIADLSARELAELDCRYESISTSTADIRFIDRMVADSRQVALNHTAGLSLPQQVQMTLFAAFALLDADQSYKVRTRGIVSGRLAKLYEGMGVRLSPDTLRAGYYAEIDLMGWAQRRYGTEFAAWLTENHEPIDPVVRLAERAGVVLLHGGGFDGPAWSVRVSLANLDDDCYVEVGAAITAVFDGYVEEWRGQGA